MFRSVHPITPGLTSKRVSSDAVLSGENSDLLKKDLRDNRFVRCSKCHFICHLDRDMRAPDGSKAEDGIDITSNTYSTVDPSGGTRDQADPTVTNGCPMCGSYMYGD